MRYYGIDFTEDILTNPGFWVGFACLVAIFLAIIANFAKSHSAKEFKIFLNDEGVVTEKPVKRNEVVMLPYLKKEGYKFDGWFVDPSFTRPFIPNSKISQDIMLYAKWVKEAE